MIQPEERENNSTNHPPDEELIGYFKGTLPEAVHDTVQAHLLGCDHCLETLADVRDFFELHRRGEQMISEDIDQQWKAVADRIREFPAAAAPVSVKATERPRRATAAVLALAAMVVIALLLGLLALSQRRQKQMLAQQLQRANQDKATTQLEKEGLSQRLKDLEQETADLNDKSRVGMSTPTPQPALNGKAELNIPIYDLYARDFAERSSGKTDANIIKPPPTAKSIVLILNGGTVTSSSSYGVEIFAPNGHSLWRGKGLRKDRLGNLILKLDRGLLAQGTHKLKLYSTDGQSGKAVAEYLLRVE